VKKLHFFERTIGANIVQDEVVLLGEPYLATYTLVAEGVSTATAASHLLQIMAGSALTVRIRWIQIQQSGLAGAAGTTRIELVRLTTAGTGGGAITAAKMDTTDGAGGVTGMTLPTVKGTETTVVFADSLGLVAAAPVLQAGKVIWGVAPPAANHKPLMIPAGTSNGIAIKNISGLASGTVDIVVSCTESSF